MPSRIIQQPEWPGAVHALRGGQLHFQTLSPRLRSMSSGRILLASFEIYPMSGWNIQQSSGWNKFGQLQGMSGGPLLLAGDCNLRGQSVSPRALVSLSNAIQCAASVPIGNL